MSLIAARLTPQLSAIVLLVLIGDCVRSLGQTGQPVQPNTVLSSVRETDARYLTVQYVLDYREYICDDPDTRSNLMPTPPDVPLFQRTRVLIEPQSGRFRINRDYASVWSSGLEPFACGHVESAFDGQFYRTWDYSRGGTELPDPKDRRLTRHGVLDKETKNLLTNLSKYGAGLENVPPYTRFARLITVLEEAIQEKNFRIVSATPEEWCLRLPDPADPSHENVMTIWYDPVRGLVNRYEINRKENGKESSIIKLFIDYKQVRPEIWFPTQADMVVPSLKQVLRYRYSDVKVNEPIKDPSIFKLVFPPGTRLRDNVEQMSYVIGEGSDQERLQVRQFTEREKLQLAESRGESPASRWRWAWWAGGVALAILGVFAARRRWLGRRRLTAVPAAIVLAVFCFYPSQAAEFRADDGNWVVEHAPGECYAISQCGSNITFFALEYFRHTDYEPSQTTRLLPPTRDGIRFSDIRDCLRAYGLETFPRRGVTADALGRAIWAGTLAILPVKVKDGLNHYVTIVRCPQRGLLIVDPPHSTMPFDKDLLANQLAQFGGLVLFVRRPVDGRRLADQVAI